MNSTAFDKERIVELATFSAAANAANDADTIFDLLLDYIHTLGFKHISVYEKHGDILRWKRKNNWLPENMLKRINSFIDSVAGKNSYLWVPIEATNIYGKCFLTKQHMIIEDHEEILSPVYAGKLNAKQLPNTLYKTGMKIIQALAGETHYIFPLGDYGVMFFVNPTSKSSVEHLSWVSAILDIAVIALERERTGRLKDIFLANISHEIRTPLNSIIGFSELLDEELEPSLNQHQKDYLYAIRHSGDRLMQTVQKVLELSQVDSGTYPLKKESFDLVATLNELVSRCSILVEQKRIILTFESQYKTAMVEADLYGVNQAITNILENAIKYTDEGQINISLEKKSGFYILKIQDTGIGISQDYLPNIFNEFSQESQGFTKKYQGIGLGMAITKRHLDINNIHVEVHSKKNKGTTFSLFFKNLNIKKSAPSNSKTKQNQPGITLNRQSKSILIIEDELFSQKLISHLLKKHFEIHLAGNADSAIEILKNHPVDLVLVDLSLEGDKDGIDMVKWIRHNKQSSKLPTIATTAHASEMDKERCLNAGFDDFLPKPIVKKTLLQKINLYI